ncbi:MAG TPA: helix-turn-helix domain-containing protein [Acidimicrobiales bacterium]|nr:helix-turn-helix domain-containing protein [Acidimicrobiales bacterium]
MSRTATSERRRLLAAPERRAAILNAAGAAFADHGFAGTSMDDVATECGVSRLILYRHFATKDALYEAVLSDVAQRLSVAFAAALEDRAGQAAVAALLSVARSDPAGYTLLWRHARREPQFAAHAEGFRNAAVAFAQGLLETAGLSGHRLRWSAETAVDYAVSAVQNWVDHEPRSRDQEFTALMNASLPAMVVAWAATG